MVAIVVVDANNRFRSTFEDLCKMLKLTFWPLSRGNHKGNSVERYHCFPNKIHTISGLDRRAYAFPHQNIKTLSLIHQFRQRPIICHNIVPKRMVFLININVSRPTSSG